MDTIDVEDISDDDESNVEKKKLRLHSKMNSSPSGDMDSEEEVSWNVSIHWHA